MVIARQKESNLLKYNVAGDCLAIKLEGDLKSWTKYFEQIQFWGEIFRTHFQRFSALGRISGIFLSTQDPIFKFLLILGLIFFICSQKGQNEILCPLWGVKNEMSCLLYVAILTVVLLWVKILVLDPITLIKECPGK